MGKPKTPTASHQRGRRKRIVSGLLVVLGAIAIATAAPLARAVLNPKALIVQLPDVPRGFELDRAESRYLPNKAFTDKTAARVVARSSRISGYERLYKKRVKSSLQLIQTRADVFQSAGGAHTFLAWMDRDQRKSNARRIRNGADPYLRVRITVGQEGWLYDAGPPAYYVLVIWRHGRVFAVLRSWGIGTQRTLVLAKSQQRRIASALR